jgi:GGDEF domain-containing protein
VRLPAVGPDGANRLGASVGVGTTTDLDAAHAPEVLIRLADRALLAAKRGGGDRVLDASSVEARAISWTDLGE